MRSYYAFGGVILLTIATSLANPLQNILQETALTAAHKVKGNIATGKMSDTTVNATAIADGYAAHAAAGAVVHHNNNRDGIVRNKQRSTINIQSAQIEAHAEASARNKAFAGVYVNQ